MLVDDDVDVNQLLVTMLEGLGCQVESCSNAEEGLRLVRGNREFDLVVTDNGLPGISGLEMVSRLRANRMEAQVVLCTGSDTEETMARASEAGVSEVLLKPFNMRELAQIVHRVKAELFA